jgi:hypothetical protein
VANRAENRLEDPEVARGLLEHIRAGGLGAGAKFLGVSRELMGKWVRGLGPDFELEVEHAKKAARSWGKAARDAVPELGKGADSPTRVPQPPQAARVVHRADVVREPPWSPLDSGYEPTEYALCSAAGEELMTEGELLQLLAYAARRPEHPLHRDAVKILSALHFGRALVRNRRLAENERLDDGPQSRVLVIRVPASGGPR